RRQLPHHDRPGSGNREVRACQRSSGFPRRVDAYGGHDRLESRIGFRENISLRAGRRAGVYSGVEGSLSRNQNHRFRWSESEHGGRLHPGRLLRAGHRRGLDPAPRHSKPRAGLDRRAGAAVSAHGGGSTLAAARLSKVNVEKSLGISRQKKRLMTVKFAIGILRRRVYDGSLTDVGWRGAGSEDPNEMPLANHGFEL